MTHVLVARLVRAAPWHALVAGLAVAWPLGDEKPLWETLGEAYGETMFACPRCQPPRPARATECPGAVVVDELRWKCRCCRARGTRYEIENTVLADTDAIDRTLDALAPQPDDRLPGAS